MEGGGLGGVGMPSNSSSQFSVFGTYVRRRPDLSFRGGEGNALRTGESSKSSSQFSVECELWYLLGVDGPGSAQSARGT